MNINFNSIFKSFIPFSIILLLVYFVTTTMYLYLPKINILEIGDNNYAIEYKKFNLLAKIYIEEGRRKDAKILLLKSIENYPYDPEAKLLLEQIS